MGIYPANAVVNAIVWLSARLQDLKGIEPREGILTHATEIRKAMEKLKDPRSIKDTVADVAKIQSQVAWDKNGQDMTHIDEGRFIVNATWRCVRIALV